ncbi:LysM peptidoglycan-binding domain-containing protein, partial [Solilutibacter pythonis]
TSSEYDAWGRRTVLREQTPKFDKRDQLDDRVRYFAYDGEGNLLRRIQGTMSLGGRFNQSAEARQYTETYAYANGRHVATGKADGKTEVLAHLTGFEASETGDITVQVQPGESLRQVAQRVYGDARYWYVLAEANGLDGLSPPTPGGSLRAPNVRMTASDANTFEPFNPNDAIGNTAPTLPYIPPPPKKKACATLAKVILVAIAVVVTIYTAGVAAGWLGAASSATGAVAGTAAAGSTLSVGASVLAGGYGAAGAVAAGVGAFTGSVVSQALGSVSGYGSFSWRQAAVSGLTAWATAGWGGYVGQAGNAFTQSLSSSSYARVAANAIVGNVSNYAASRAVGAAASFSWRSMAANTVGAVLTRGVGSRLGLEQTTSGAPGGTGKFWNDLATGMIGNVVTAHSRQALGAQRGGIDYGDLAADAFGNALGNA